MYDNPAVVGTAHSLYSDGEQLHTASADESAHPCSREAAAAEAVRQAKFRYNVPLGQNVWETQTTVWQLHVHNMIKYNTHTAT